ncbi:hypothetical protein SAMN04487934_1177 [Eubacterium ruminantium]|nr:hypothetical protein SAMN04487934_1177 [Eubacterium ruminantium]
MNNIIKRIKDYKTDLVIIIGVTLVLIGIAIFIPRYALSKEEKKIINTVEEEKINSGKLYSDSVTDNIDNEQNNMDITKKSVKDMIIDIITTKEYADVIKHAPNYYSFNEKDGGDSSFSDTFDLIIPFFAKMNAELSDDGVELDRFIKTGRSGEFVDTSIEDRLLVFMDTVLSSGKYIVVHFVTSEKTGAPLYFTLQTPPDCYVNICDILKKLYLDKYGLNFISEKTEYFINNEKSTQDGVMEYYNNMEYKENNMKADIVSQVISEEGDKVIMIINMYRRSFDLDVYEIYLDVK